MTNAVPSPKDKTKLDLQCPTCGKQPELCLCSLVVPMESRLHVLLLQHPQEPDKTLGSARLTRSTLANSTLKVGLSWPNLSKALGREATPAKWAVLYLGAKHDEVPKGERIRILNKHGEYYAPEDAGLEGIIILDGTWSQAKTLWWRNAWLLKLKRIVLSPTRPSLYGELRREPRPDALSTIEAVAETLDALGEDSKIGETLRGHFSELVTRCRKLGPATAIGPDEKPAKQPKRDWRRRRRHKPQR